MIYAIATLFATWVIGFWLLLFIPIPFHILISVSTSIFLIFSLFQLAHQKHSLTTYITLFFFAILAIPYAILFTKEIAPSGQDMSMHAYLARIIIDTNGFPKTMRPVVPLDHFGYYPVGFPVVLAAISILTRLPTVTGALLLSEFSYWLFPVSLFILLRKRFPVYVSMLVAAIASWANPIPNNIIWWGANPTVLSLDFIILALSASQPVLLFIFLYAAFLIHVIPIAGICYLALPLAPFTHQTLSLFLKRSFRNTWLLIFCVIVILPFLWHLLSFHWNISEATKYYVLGLHRADLVTWAGAPLRIVGVRTIQFILNSFSRITLILYGASLLIIWFRNRAHVLIHIVQLTTLYLLLINAHYWILPASSLLYPDRIIPLELIPISIGIAEALTILTIRWKKYAPVLLILFVLCFIPDMANTYRWFLRSSSISMVTSNDLSAFQWLKTHTTSADIIMNNYDDAGVWIPAIVGRQITTYHTNPLDLDELKKIKPIPTFAFVGARSVPSNMAAVIQPDVKANSKKYTLVKHFGNAKIYRVR